MKIFKIAYGAGHGFNTAGKRSPNGEREWSFNNKVALAFEKNIKNYQNVQLLRVDDPTGRTDVPLATRVSKANSWGADIYISFHHNAFQSKWGTHTGTETFHFKGSVEGQKLARLVHTGVVKAYGLRDRGLKTNNLYITRKSKMPAILIEGGFMDSNIDIKKLRNDKVLENAGLEVAKAVASYAKLQSKPISKPKPTSPTTSNTKAIYRVRLDGKQVGAYGNVDNILDVVKNNLDKKLIEVERI